MELTIFAMVFQAGDHQFLQEGSLSNMLFIKKPRGQDYPLRFHCLEFFCGVASIVTSWRKRGYNRKGMTSYASWKTCIF